MSDEQDNGDDSDVEENRGPLGGERLAQARREQQITVLEVAKELHLDEPKVRALERNDFDVLGAPVFAKGHLRKYAQLVGVDEADVFADYYAMTRSAPMPPIVVGRRKTSQELSPGPWIAIIIVVLAAAASYWWFAVRESAVEIPAPAREIPADEEAQLRPPAQAVRLPEPAAEVADAAIDDSAVPLADEPPVESRPSTLTDGEIQLALRFSGDCWTEISDADGRRLFFNMGRNGQTVAVSGKAPLSALFGNADNVSVQVNGTDYALPDPGNASRTVTVAILEP